MKKSYFYLCLFVITGLSKQSFTYGRDYTVNCAAYQSKNHIIPLKIFKNLRKKNYLNVSVAVDQECRIVPHNQDQTNLNVFWVVNKGKRSEHCETPKPSQYKDYIGHKNIHELNKSTILSNDRQMLLINSSPLKARMDKLGNYPIHQNQLVLEVFKTQNGCESQLSMSIKNNNIYFDQIDLDISIWRRSLVGLKFSYKNRTTLNIED